MTEVIMGNVAPLREEIRKLRRSLSALSVLSKKNSEKSYNKGWDDCKKFYGVSLEK